MSRSPRGRAKRAQRDFDEIMRAALRTGHEEGLHTDSTTQITDPTGYWSEYGCELCIATARSRTEDFEIIERRPDTIGDLRLDVFTLRQRDVEGVWTAIIYQMHAAHDTVIDPRGRIRTTAVPAGLWLRLSQEYGKEEK